MGYFFQWLQNSDFCHPATPPDWLEWLTRYQMVRLLIWLHDEPEAMSQERQSQVCDWYLKMGYGRLGGHWSSVCWKACKERATQASDSVVKCHARTAEACKNLHIVRIVLTAGIATQRKEKVPFARNVAVTRLRSCILEYLNGNSYSVVTTLVGNNFAW